MQLSQPDAESGGIVERGVEVTGLLDKNREGAKRVVSSYQFQGGQDRHQPTTHLQLIIGKRHVHARLLRHEDNESAHPRHAPHPQTMDINRNHPR